ncbi:hypothetical protein H6758_01880 [Candidatus Nomurabacteria bacterium]|nr:hypothetical protein [Candidatus Nomurabacteria bacterium]
MNLYEFEGKHMLETYGIKVPRGFQVKRGENLLQKYEALRCDEVVVKAQVLIGKRGKNGAIRLCSGFDEFEKAVQEIFAMEVRGQHVAYVRVEEKVDIDEEQYLSITYDTNAKTPILVYSKDGGMDIEDVPEEKIEKYYLDIKSEVLGLDIPFAEELWNCFLQQDCRVVEVNPLIKTKTGEFIAADAKIALDDDAFFRHQEWEDFEPRTMMGRPPTDREVQVQEIDRGEKYYQGTAGKYIEMDGDVGLILNGGGASIANMDALADVGLKPANYTEYSGNPPREKVYELTKIVLSKPGLRGLWLCGVVANFTNVRDTFAGIVDAFDEMKPTYPIVVRRAGPNEKEGMELMRECGKRNNLNIKLFGKETSMGDTAKVLADMINKQI